MIPTKELSQPELVSRLRPLIDRLRDPEHRIINPEAFAMDYHVLLVLASKHREQLSSTHVTHNLGVERIQILNDLLAQVDQLPVGEDPS